MPSNDHDAFIYLHITRICIIQAVYVYLQALHCNVEHALETIVPQFDAILRVSSWCHMAT